MTDISGVAPTADRRSNWQRLNIPALRIGASFFAISVLFGAAFKMTYVDPYTSLRRRPQVVPDDDLGGRDPSW
jgi:hypothetical protein